MSQLPNPSLDLQTLAARWERRLACEPLLTTLRQSIHEGGLDLETAWRLGIVFLFEQRDLLLERVVEAEALEPRRLELPDGTILRFDVPDSALPVLKLFGGRRLAER